MRDSDHLLPAIVAGDASAFGRWLAFAEPRMRAALASYAAQVDTEAILQEALLRLWNSAPRVEPDGSGDSLLRYGVRIARNLAHDEARRLRTLPTEPAALERVLADTPAPELPPDPLLRRLIDACRRRLAPKPAAALDARLAATGGESDETLAARLGMRPNTFLQNVTRARKLLAECLRRGGVELEGASS